MVVIIRRSTRLLAHPRPDVQYPYVKPLLTQVLISFAVFFVRLVARIAQGAQGGFRSTSRRMFTTGLFEYAAINEWVFGVFEYPVSAANHYDVFKSANTSPSSSSFVCGPRDRFTNSSSPSVIDTAKVRTSRTIVPWLSSKACHPLNPRQSMTSRLLQARRERNQSTTSILMTMTKMISTTGCGIAL